MTHRVGGPGEMRCLTTMYPPRAQGFKPAARNIKEGLMTSLWFTCAVFAVVVVFFILIFLLYNGYPAFSTIGLPEFPVRGHLGPIG